MRRGIAVAVVCGFAAVLVAGCGNPGGVDGSITDDWVAVSEPKSFVPEAGACHEATYAVSGSLSTYAPVDCTEPHRGETIYVGTFSGAATTRRTPPPKGSVQLRPAYAECDEQARTYLGEDFRHGRLWLGVVVPSASGWDGGARWFRCDLYEVTNVEEFGEPVTRQASLKGELTGDSPLALGCYQVTADASGSIDSMKTIACTTAHNSEFVGVYAAPAAAGYPKSDADWQRMHTGCRGAVASYVKVPNDAELKFRTGTVAVPNLEDDWKAGNHGVRCYLYLKDAKFTKSLEGAGSKALPVR
jgi:hypothetical protein